MDPEIFKRTFAQYIAKHFAELLVKKTLMSEEMLSLETKPLNTVRAELARTEAHGRDGDQALVFRDPLEDTELLDDVLDAEAVFHMEDAPRDPLDDELADEEHLASCTSCQRHATICAHCLEPRMCKALVVGERVTVQYVYLENNQIGETPIHIPVTLQLCRRCRNDARIGVLVVE